MSYSMVFDLNLGSPGVIKRSPHNEAIWSGDVLIDRTPRGKAIEWIKAGEA